MDSLALVLAILFIAAEQDTIVVTTGPHHVNPKYHQTDYETACGSTVVRVRYRQGPEESGRVDHVLIDGRRVRDAAETLQILAARRSITGMEIFDCGTDRRRPVFRGAMTLSEAESQAARMVNRLFFRLSRVGNDWQLTMD